MLPWMSILMGEKALASSRSVGEHCQFRTTICHLDMIVILSPKSLMASVLASTKSLVAMVPPPSDALGNLTLKGSSKAISLT